MHEFWNFSLSNRISGVHLGKEHFEAFLLINYEKARWCGISNADERVAAPHLDRDYLCEVTIKKRFRTKHGVKKGIGNKLSYTFNTSMFKMIPDLYVKIK